MDVAGWKGMNWLRPRFDFPKHRVSGQEVILVAHLIDHLSRRDVASINRFYSPWHLCLRLKSAPVRMGGVGGGGARRGV